MNNFKPLVIVLAGPTASGKTALAIELAKRLELAILNIDSRQVYKGMNIGTAKPTKQQQIEVKHHLIDIRQPNKPLTLQEFHDEAIKCIEEIFRIKKVAFLVGGSGLYLKSLTSGFKPPAVAPQHGFRNYLNSLGQEFCYELLQLGDPIAAKRIARQDEVRTKRALEVLYATGSCISELQKFEPPKWNILELGLDPKNLKDRINNRTQCLYRSGLVEETQWLINKFGESLPLMQTIGYQEALKLIKREYSLETAIKETNRRTTQFAKRQRTWFRGQHNIQWLNDDDPLQEAMTLINKVLVCRKQT